ncbi:hypothetical protein [Ornithinimicrobium kibberense]|uniref:hypothetical protein n=1 Tax=Ornithinimicrobium kibberense TaxID=282060 RepID=UPI003622C5A3
MAPASHGHVLRWRPCGSVAAARGAARCLTSGSRASWSPRWCPGARGRDRPGRRRSTAGDGCCCRPSPTCTYTWTPPASGCRSARTPAARGCGR